MRNGCFSFAPVAVRCVSMTEKTVLFAGGGTMGPVTPLLAVWRTMKRRRNDLSLAWAGTPDGPEREAVESEGGRFFPVPVVKIPRYPSTRWISWPFAYLKASRVASRIISETMPLMIGSVGGFTATPIIRRGSRTGIPCAIHQLDYEPGLSNRFVARLCKSVTTSYEYGAPPFSGVKSDRVPTPCRFAGRTPLSKEDACRSFELDPSRPVIFVLGGGTGSKAINDAIGHIRKDLVALTQIIHLTGKGKGAKPENDVGAHAMRPGLPGSITKEFFNEDEMFRAFCAADLVISRAGIGTISEVACLSKPTILIPIPKSHQEKNAVRLPCDVITQKKGFHDRLLARIHFYLTNEQERLTIGKKLHEAFPVDDGSALAERWLGLI